MMCRVFIATSLDGYIARPDGSLDWLPQAPPDKPDSEDYGYRDFMNGIDGIVLGRNTYDLAKTFSPWPYGTRPVVVLTHRPIEVSLPNIAQVRGMAATPAKIITYLAGQGATSLYIDGGQTIQQFLAAGQIHELIISRIPILIGQGIPLFGPLTQDLHLQHQQTRSYRSGLVQSHYRVG